MNEGALPGFAKSGHPVALHEYTGLENERPESDADTSVDFPANIGLVAMLICTVCPVAGLTVSAGEVPENVLPDASDATTVNAQFEAMPVAVDW